MRRRLYLFCVVAIISVTIWWRFRSEPLLEALRKGDSRAVLAYLDKGGDPNTILVRYKKGDCAQNLLSFAARFGLAEVVDRILTHKGIGLIHNDWTHPLLEALDFEDPARDYLPIITKLIQRGEYLNATDINGQTALIKVSGTDHVEIFEMLINAGVDTKIIDSLGHDARFYLEKNPSPTKNRMLLLMQHRQNRN